MNKKTMALFEVLAGKDRDVRFFYVVADDTHGRALERAMKAIFERFGAKTSEQLPKPFNMRRVEQEVVTA